MAAIILHHLISKPDIITRYDDVQREEQACLDMNRNLRKHDQTFQKLHKYISDNTCPDVYCISNKEQT